MTDHYNEWMRRAFIGNLGMGNEIWQPLAPDHPAYIRLKVIYGKLSREFDAKDATYEMSRNLLYDVIFAAGTIDYTCTKIKSLTDQILNEYKGSLKNDGEHLTNDQTVGVYVEFMSLLSWARTLVERLYNTYAGHKYGLLSLITSGDLKNAVAAAKDKHLSWAPEIRMLSNYSLHIGAPNGQSFDGEIRSGKIIYPIPGPTTERIVIWHTLKYTKKYNVVDYSNKVTDDVYNFMDALLLAFENAVPARFKK